ncbi:SGNH/GDSL hydrolase family protein [Desulfovibrio sp. TomC]|uniref:SGNH/GDSL hydrolase family protein n=1 Tax=Desulfovibrio sp. TomC TaxID=1562888 RepID=UPI0018CE14CF|nr:SGNH/GDSL hydrolase family protein [Desulfovibrio sp. TomC]
MGRRGRWAGAAVLAAVAAWAWFAFSGPDPAARLVWLDHHAFRNDPAATFDPVLGFRLRPSVSLYGFRHNAAGLVGEEIGPKRPGTVRVACLGGSTTLGAGVETDRYAYPALLQAMFDRTTGGVRRVEVLNAGVFGYHSLHTPLRVAELGALAPDVYVIMDGLNDLDAARSVPLATLERARLGRLAGWRRDLGRLAAGEDRLAASRVPGMHDLEAKWALIGYRDNLAQAVSLAEKQGAAVLLVSDPLRLEAPEAGTGGPNAEQARLLAFGRTALPAAAASVAEATGAARLDVQPVFDAALASPASVRRVWSDSLHLTRYGYFLLARQVYLALAAREPAAAALAGAPVLDDARLEAVCPECLAWRPADGSGRPKTTEGAVRAVAVTNLKDSPADAEGWSSFSVAEGGGAGEIVLPVPPTARSLRIYPRIQGPGDVVAVESVAPDGGRTEVFALRKGTDDGIWSPVGEWYRLALPEGADRRIMVRVTGENAQVFHQGPAVLFADP